MTNLIAFGQDPRAFYTQNLLSQTTDGINWQMLPKPAGVHERLRSVATDGSNFVAVGEGVAAYTVDLANNWLSYDLFNGWLNLQKVIYNGSGFYAVGSSKSSNNLNEQATVFVTGSGIDISVWVQQYLVRNSYSGLTDITSLGGNSLLAVGYQNGMTAPLLLLSEDGVVWRNIAVDPALQGPLFSVEYRSSDNRVWIGGQGWIATGIWNGSNTAYVVSNNLLNKNKTRSITAILNSGNQTVAVGANTVWYSNNDTDWQGIFQDGYNFSSISYYQSRWYLGTTTLMNRYTAFTLSGLGGNTVLTGINTGVQATDWLQV